MKRISAPGMILFAITLTFASWDWLMSLDAHWYSTIFGAYYFSGCALSALVLVTLTAIYLRSKQVLVHQITVEHYHDLAKLTFAFTVFWAYMAFSQYFLIWYANIPEETIWFKHRWDGSWKTISLLLVIGHFAVPFLVLISRAAKRSTKVLLSAGVWLLFMHWIDLYWLVMPNLHQHGFVPSWMDLTTMLGIGGIFLGLTWKRSGCTAAGTDQRSEIAGINRIRQSIGQSDLNDVTQKHIPDDGYERRDVNIRAIFIVGVVIVLVITVFLVFLKDVFVLNKEQMMFDYVLKPESAALRDVRARDLEVLTTYKLLDPAKKIYRIPITRAMELLADEAYREQPTPDKRGGK